MGWQGEEEASSRGRRNVSLADPTVVLYTQTPPSWILKQPAELT